MWKFGPMNIKPDPPPLWCSVLIGGFQIGQAAPYAEALATARSAAGNIYRVSHCFCYRGAAGNIYRVSPCFCYTGAAGNIYRVSHCFCYRGAAGNIYRVSPCFCYRGEAGNIYRVSPCFCYRGEAGNNIYRVVFVFATNRCSW